MIRCEVSRPLGVNDGKKDRDGIGSARGGVLSAEVHLIHLPEGVDKAFQAACDDGFGHIEVGLFAILVGRVMGEVRTDDKEVLRGEVRLEKLRYLLQYIKMRRADDDGNNRRDLGEDRLDERQLHLQAVLPVVGVTPVGENAVSFHDELPPRLGIDGDLSQRRLCKRVSCIDARPLEGHPVAGAQEEHPFIAVPPWDAAEGRCCHFAAVDVASMGHDERLGCSPFRYGVEPGPDHGSDLLG